MTERPLALGSLLHVTVTHSMVADVLWLVGVLCACGVHVQHTHVSLNSGIIPSLKSGCSIEVPSWLVLAIRSPIPGLSLPEHSPRLSPPSKMRENEPGSFSQYTVAFPLL